MEDPEQDRCPDAKHLAILDARDYDVEYYARLLRATYAARLARAFAAEDFEMVFADPDQLSLFETALGAIRPVLRLLPSPAW